MTVQPDLFDGKPQLTAKRLREVLHYNPETGVFTWRVNRGTAIKSGKRAGHYSSKGYRGLTVDNIGYSEHRAVFLYMTGQFPIGQVDHINCKKDDNRWCNLRLATNGQNKQNSGTYKNNKSGVRGVIFEPEKNLWMAYLWRDKALIFRRRFKSFDDAVAARKEAERLYHGEYAYQGDHQPNCDPNIPPNADPA